MTTTSSSMGTEIPSLCISTTSSSSIAAPCSLSQGAAVHVVMHHRLDTGSSAGDTQERERSPRPARRGASYDVGIRPSAASARSDAGSTLAVRRPASLGSPPIGSGTTGVHRRASRTLPKPPAFMLERSSIYRVVGPRRGVEPMEGERSKRARSSSPNPCHSTSLSGGVLAMATPPPPSSGQENCQ